MKEILFIEMLKCPRVKNPLIYCQSNFRRNLQLKIHFLSRMYCKSRVRTPGLPILTLLPTVYLDGHHAEELGEVDVPRPVLVHNVHHVLPNILQ